MSLAHEIGRIGEQMVADFLQHNGHIILRRNYIGAHGEIDIIAENRKELIFVEVKTRSEDFLVSPADAVDVFKQHRIISTATEFMRKLHYDGDFRFDIAEVVYKKDQNGNRSFSLNYIKNAFQISRH